MSSNKPVICLGLACLDNRMTVDEFPPKLHRERVWKQWEAPGGPAGAASITIARLGGQASFWGQRGGDTAGERMEAILSGEGIDTTYFRAFDGAQSPRCEVFIRPDGERYLFPYSGEGLPTESDWLPLDLVESAGAVLLDGRWPQAAVRLARKARDCGVPVVFDLHSATDYDWELAELATHTIADEEMAEQVGGVESMLARLDGPGKWPAVTVGERGVINRGGSFPAFEVEVLDSTGAGDVFHGAFAWALTQGMSEVEALPWASAAAALRCKLGDVPRLDQVAGLLEEPAS